MDCETLAKLERRLRPLYGLLPPNLAVGLMSWGRKRFHQDLVNEKPRKIHVPEGLSKKVWGITFRSPIMNASGMFKEAEGYEMSYLQGAGGFLAGTTTFKDRDGHKQNGIHLPVSFYSRSGTSHNMLSLPNCGHLLVARHIGFFEKRKGFPIGISVMIDPGSDPSTSLDNLITGMQQYERAGVDFIEINMSCPNTGHALPDYSKLKEQLTYVRDNFLKRDSRPPVTVKFSNDTQESHVASLVCMLIDLGYDGVNFGNTSVDYKIHLPKLSGSEKSLYKFFSKTFGGGVGGRVLKEQSYILTRKAVEIREGLTLQSEFAVIRTGGIESVEDLLDSHADLNQWFTGYFQAFSFDGHRLYQTLYDDLMMENNGKVL